MSAGVTACRVDLVAFLRNYSAEVTSGDRNSIEAATDLMPRGSEIYIASLPSDKEDRTVDVAAQLKRAGLTPVPHIVARNIRNHGDFDTLVRRLVEEAGIDRALVLGGDRERPAGDFESSLQLLQSAVFGRYGLKRIALSWYPEGHPRIPHERLTSARGHKLRIATEAGFDVKLISQFCFESEPIIATARLLRSEGVRVPLRVGVAGPASRASLLKYAMICGVGASVRALHERPGARAMIRGETPQKLLSEIAVAQHVEPDLGFEGVHFFTFASLRATARFVQEQVHAGVPA